jgi:hypothetical protein
MCLLLTLLAVPVFYSLFDDAQQSRIWRGASDRFDKFKLTVLRPAYEKFASSFRNSKREKAVAEENLDADVYPETGK